MQENWASTLEDRMDSQPVGAEHRRVTLLSGLGWMFDAMDIGLLSLVVVALAQDWGLSEKQVGVVISIGLLGMFVGAAVSGSLADRYGRKVILLLTMLVYAVATGFTALAWGYGALLALRFITGLGLGGELPVASTLVAEVAPVRQRGRMVVLLESFWAYGWILAALVGYLVIPEFGWRAAFAIGALPALYVLVLRRRLPESPRYLLRRGRCAEAREIAARFGIEVEDPAREDFGEASVVRGVGIRALWAASYTRRTAMLWVLWFRMVFSYYGIFTWLPQILATSGYSVVRSFQYVLLITLAQIPGYFSAAYLVEKWGRKRTLVGYLLGCAAATLVFGIRGIAGPYIVGLMLGAPGFGTLAIFSMFAMVLLIIAGDVWILGEETQGRSLDEISGQPVIATSGGRG